MNTTISKQIAKHFKEVYFGGNWTWSNLKDQLKEVSWREATTKVEGFNGIEVLVFHIHYFVNAALMVLQGNELNAHDKYSFSPPPIQSDEDWQAYLNSIWNEAELFIQLVEELPDEQLNQIFADEKYGNYYRNLHGIIEHTHYHLGQIALMKKIIAKKIYET